MPLSSNMDAFGDNFVIDSEVDPVAEFVAREQDQLAGLEDEILSVSMPASTTGPNTDGNQSSRVFVKIDFFNTNLIQSV